MGKILSLLILITVLPILSVFAQKEPAKPSEANKAPVNKTSNENSESNEQKYYKELQTKVDSLANEIKVLKSQVNDVNQIHLLISGAIVLLIILVGFLTLRSFSKMRRHISKQGIEVEKLSFQLSDFNKTIPKDPPTVSVTQEVPISTYHPHPITFTETPSVEKVYFGGPSKEGYFLTEYQSETMEPSQSLFEFTISIHDPSFATFNPIPNEYTVGTITYNLETFERVCEIHNFSSNARNMEIMDAGKAVLQGGIWKVTDKATIRLS